MQARWRKNIPSLKKYLVLLLVACIGDAVTTYYGLSLGYVETRLLGTVPMLNVLVLGMPLLAISKFQLPHNYEVIRSALCMGLVLFSFSGMFWNLFGLLFMAV